jgi:hypothetical protein
MTTVSTRVSILIDDLVAIVPKPFWVSNADVRTTPQTSLMGWHHWYRRVTATRERIDMGELRRSRIAGLKFMGIVFATLTIFFFGYVLWTVLYAHPTIFQVIGRSADLATMAFITYYIHSEIRSRLRYKGDLDLYKRVDDMRNEKRNGE